MTKAFACTENKAVGFDSSWKIERVPIDANCQTEPLQVSESGVQVINVVEVCLQTEEEKTSNSFSPENNDDRAILQFLTRVAPKMEEELTKARLSRAFDSYEAFTNSEDDAVVRKISVLRWQDLHNQGIVGCCDWSCTGSVVGVAYGIEQHDDWCDHKSTIALWNINRSDFTSSKPEKTVEANSCVRSLAFHPIFPAVFAVGTINGEVFVYDLAQFEFKTPVSSVEAPGGEISTVLWGSSYVGGVRSAQLPLVATTSEGLILAWSLNMAKQELSLIAGYIVLSEDVPREARGRSGSNTGIGISGMSLNSEDPTLFILGIEGGGVLLGSFLSQNPSSESLGSITLYRCVTASFSSHSGSVLGIQSSPHHRNGFFSLGSDNEVRLHTLLKPSKSLSTHYFEEGITCCCFSLSRPLVIAVGKVSGEISFIRLDSKVSTPILTLPPHEKPSPITKICFNKKNMSLLCSGDQLGRATIWQLPHSVVSAEKGEMNSFARLLAVNE